MEHFLFPCENRVNAENFLKKIFFSTEKQPYWMKPMPGGG